MSTLPYITGIGLVTPLALSADATWQRLCAGDYIRTHSRVPLEIAKDRPRVHELAMRAAREAMGQAGWNDASSETAIVVGTSKGSVESWIANRGCSPFGLADIANVLASELNLGRSPRTTLSAACASGLHALIRAALMIRFREARRVLVVAVESSLHPLFLASFDRLGVLPKEEIGCRPFDQTRDGFLMSEAAAAICLEGELDEGKGRSSPPIARVENFALGGDATHITNADPEGTTLRRLLRETISDRPVDLIHAHATGTLVNDPIELNAIEASIQPLGERPILYSHKGALGHSLGAAGLVAVAINCLSHRHGLVPPNVRTRSPLPTHRVILTNDPLKRAVRRSVAMATGFGGPTAVISLVSP